MHEITRRVEKMKQLTRAEKFINLAQQIHKNISQHSQSIWPGFTPVPFILYNDEFQIAVGNNWPDHYKKVKENIWLATGTDDQLMANTAILYHDKVVAIWDIRTWPEDIDAPQATASIFHEMFHAYQELELQLNWANELLAPTYPHTKKSVALILAENDHLLDIIKTPDAKSVAKSLNNIAKLRFERQAEIGADYIDYDQSIETTEGTAVYVEVKMLSILTKKPISEIATAYLNALITTDETLRSYRRRLYTVGLILCLSCDALKLDLQNGWKNSNSSIFAWIKTQLAPQMEAEEGENLINEENLNLAEKLIIAHESEKERQILSFTKQPLTKLEGEIKIVNFDPMNIICHNGQCLHKHGRIKINEEEKLLEYPFLVEYEGNIFNIKKMFVPTNRNIEK